MASDISPEKGSPHDVGIEKGAEVQITPASPPEPSSSSGEYEKSSHKFKTLKHINARIEGLAGFEARGLERAPDDERQPASAMSMLQMLLLWFSANMTINNLAVGILGPVGFSLGFADSTWCAVVGVLLGAIMTAYMSTWGPVSGNRTMVVTRFFLGYYPSKITTLLNIILMLGYGTIDCIIAGQVLSAVSGGTMTIAVGIVIIAVIECIIAAVGLRLFHIYESSVTGRTLAANRLSFLSLCFYVPNSWGAASSDYYVYYPVSTPKWKTFMLTLGGLALSFWFVDLIGVGLGCGIAALPSWSDAYDISSGALITAGFSPLGGFGKSCSVIIALGVLANCVPGTYSAAIGCQIMGRWGQMLPRWTWVVFLCIVQLVCGLAGRTQLYIIFTNFLALMSYWLSFMVCIVFEEHVIFRPKLDWTAWADRSKLPIGIAALISFLIGWVGAIVEMYEVYYVGPLAIAAGSADVGVRVGCAFTLVTFPPMRYLELKKFGR